MSLRRVASWPLLIPIKLGAKLSPISDMQGATLKVAGLLAGETQCGKQPYTCITATSTRHGSTADEVSGGNIPVAAKMV